MKSLDQLKSFSGSATGTMKTFSFSPRPSSDSHSIRSFTNLKITTERMVKEHASVKGDLEMATTKLKKSMEHIHALEEKLQHAFNENAKFKVKQRGDEKLWKGLESKFSSIKTLCDQLTETLQFLAGQVQADSVGLDSLNEQINSLSLKLENAEETIIKCLKELEELKSEREERKNFYRDEQSRQSSLIEEKECFSQHLGRWMHLYPSEAVYDRPFLYEKGWNKKLNYAFGIARDGVHDLTKRYTKKWHEHGVHCIIPCGYYIDSAGGFNNLSFISGQAIQVWVDCDGAAKHINVLLAPIDHAMKPITPLLSRSLDLSPDVEDTMFVGFSASTGTVLAKHYVLGWSFKMNGQAQELNISHLPKLSESPELLAEKNEPNAIRFLKIIGVPLMSICFFIFIIVVVFSLRKRKFAEVLEDWELDYSPHRFEYKYLYTAPNFVQIVSLIYL